MRLSGVYLVAGDDELLDPQGNAKWPPELWLSVQLSLCICLPELLIDTCLCNCHCPYNCLPGLAVGRLSGVHLVTGDNELLQLQGNARCPPELVVCTTVTVCTTAYLAWL